MSVPAHAPCAAVPDLPSALRAVSARGLRLTAARRAVIGALFAAGGPRTAEQLHQRLAPRCDLASVYRNLEVLEDAGIVRHAHVGHGPGVYAPATALTEAAVCERCGARRALDPRFAERLREAVRATVGFVPRFDHTPLAGLCARCAERASTKHQH